jgi:hypothetical protein
VEERRPQRGVVMYRSRRERKLFMVKIFLSDVLELMHTWEVIYDRCRSVSTHLYGGDYQTYLYWQFHELLRR